MKSLSLGSCLHESSKLNAVVFREDTNPVIVGLLTNNPKLNNPTSLNDV